MGSANSVSEASRISTPSRDYEEDKSIRTFDADMIANVLSQDPSIAPQFRKLCSELNMNSYTTQRLVVQFSMDKITYHELLRRIFLEWISQEGQKATLKRLCDVLERMDFYNARDLLIETLDGNKKHGQSGLYQIRFKR